jgi:phosphoribosylamine--glycine ligase
MEQIMTPTVRAMAAEGRPFRGILYAGLMIKDGAPKVLEFNARLGDPEAQPLLMRLDGDLVPILEAVVDRRLRDADVRWHPDPAVCVVMASGGYPGAHDSGRPIHGLAEAEAMEGVVVFHAGTARSGDAFVNAGGRVLGVTARDATIGAAIDRAYRAVRRIRWDGVHYRTDIGRKALDRPAIAAERD